MHIAQETFQYLTFLTISTRPDQTLHMLEKLLASGAQLLHFEEAENIYYVIYGSYFYCLQNRELHKICNFSHEITQEEVELSEDVNEENMVTQPHRDVYWMIRVRIPSSDKLFCFRI